LSFFAAGQRIPEDLEAASAERVLELVLPSAAGRTRSAA
jgi:flagellar biosynthesis GTPase FlhF